MLSNDHIRRVISKYNDSNPKFLELYISMMQMNNWLQQKQKLLRG
uniref:Uncharacterized protein n=1 Tax=Rhizophora mucronata TaxID=61149 RepID=A0A2P2NZ26_RHIMU